MQKSFWTIYESDTQRISAGKNMCDLPASLSLAKEMGARLGAGEILQ
jgi:hypothetical protein